MALHAKGDAVCSFDVDHIFPWSRGGLSIPENLMAVYWGANRHVKVSCPQCFAFLSRPGICSAKWPISSTELTALGRMYASITS